MSLHSLLRWAHVQWTLETPELGHSVALTDDGGAPAMKPAVASYLGLQARRLLGEQASKVVGRPLFGVPPIARVGAKAPVLPPLGGETRADNWQKLAGRRDKDGKYVTPLRYAIELAPDGERPFLRALVPELYFPSEITLLYGVPRWAAQFVMYAALERLRVRYDGLMRDQEKGTAANVGWVSRSDAQRNAETAA